MKCNHFALYSMKKYKIIYADPPWPYKSTRPFGSNTQYGVPGAKLRYPLMSLEEIKELSIPSTENAHLYLWTTNAFMVEAHEVALAWGFQPKTVITWVKIKADGTPSMKMGYYFRGATEHLIFSVKGKLRLKEKNLPTAFLLPRTKKHSEKPDFFRKMIERNSDGNKLELFAREKTPGWDVWGNEVENDIELFDTPSE